MNKIEIDTSEVSLEEQIKAAHKNWHEHDRFFQEVLRDFAAGKFAKAPLPEIRKPKWVDCAVVLSVAGSLTPQFKVVANGFNGSRAWGPYKPTEREAILAFNELFGEKP